MLKQRVIPFLLLKHGGLVKTVNFSNPKYVGDPINAISIFNSKEVDELIVVDICASREDREPDFKLIEKFASECFMPLCYGGGIRTFNHAKQLFSVGVEKISIQSAVLSDTRLISEITAHYGNQSVVVSVDLRESKGRDLLLYSYLKRKVLKTNIFEYLDKVIKAGAGELIINFVDRDGTMNGMAYDAIKILSNSLAVPMIAAGGAGSLQDIRRAIDAGASAIAVGSLFVFHGPHKAVLITYPQYCELELLLKGVNEED